MEKSFRDLEASFSSADTDGVKPECDSSSATSTSFQNISKTRTKDLVDVPPHVCQALHSQGLFADDFGVVRWQVGTISHPRRWPLLRKSYDSAIICAMEFMTTFVSNVGSTVVPYAMVELNVSQELGIFYFTTLYLLGQALGGLIFPPLAESFGGHTIYTTSIFGFAACCVVIGSVPSVPVIIVFRFISGFLSAMPSVVGAGSMENMWHTKARIWLIHMWIAAAVLALALAPAIATAVSESSLGWQWLFYIFAIVCAVLTILCAYMKESRPAQALRLHVKDISHSTQFRKLSVDDTNEKPQLSTFVQSCLTMPIRLFFTEPIVFATSIMGATVYGAIYLFTAALPDVYIESFGFSALASSLVFISIAVGVLFTFLPRIYDVRVSCRKSIDSIEPEDKLFGFYVAAPILAIGFWWFAFAVPPLNTSASPWASIISLALFGYSVVEFDNVLSGYLCDTYASSTASALAPMSFLRAVLSGTFPLFGQQMFTKLDANHAMFVLAGVATLFCAMAALFRVYGKRIRERSPIAQRTASVSSE